MASLGGSKAFALLLVGMMAAATFQLARPRWKHGSRLRAAVLLAGGFALSFILRMPPIQVLAIGALVGLIWRAPAEV